MADKNVPLTVAPELAEAIKAAAHAEGKTPDEWVAEAAQDKLRKKDLDDRWQKLTAYGRENERRHGFNEEDVERLIHEHRQGR